MHTTKIDSPNHTYQLPWHTLQRQVQNKNTYNVYVIIIVVSDHETKPLASSYKDFLRNELSIKVDEESLFIITILA